MSSGRSEVTFTNSYGKKMYVAYMRRDFNCQAECGGIWDVLGWISLDPGETEPGRTRPITDGSTIMRKPWMEQCGQDPTSQN